MASTETPRPTTRSRSLARHNSVTSRAFPIKSMSLNECALRTPTNRGSHSIDTPIGSKATHAKATNKAVAIVQRSYGFAHSPVDELRVTRVAWNTPVLHLVRPPVEGLRVERTDRARPPSRRDDAVHVLASLLPIAQLGDALGRSWRSAVISTQASPST
jgi:hypothetical protein